MPAKFVHLHNHTEFSLLDGAQKIPDMVRRAETLEMPAVAMTDHGNLFGAIKFYKTAKNTSVKPIIGCEVYVAPGSRFEKSAPQGATRSKPYFHLVLLAEDQTGYRNLVKLSSAGFLEGFYYRPRIDKELLREHHAGLIALSACLAGEIPTRIRQQDLGEARRALDSYLEIFGAENFYLELQDQGLPEEPEVNRGLVQLARDNGVKLVATNDCHFLTREDHDAHAVLICIGTGKKLDDESRMTYSPEHYFKTAEEMEERFAWVPEALANTLEIADRCNVKLDFGTHHVPEYPVQPGETYESVFEQKARQGFSERRVVWEAQAAQGQLRHTLDEYEARLETELQTIQQMGFPGYFLVVQDFINWAKDNGIPVGPGRGSAAGSLVAFCLKITDIDPLQYDLLFERFLNPERVSMPDIDVDFCFRRRGEVIDYVTQKYGRENVSQIITFGTLAAKAAIKDSARVLDFSFSDADRIAKLIPDQVGAHLADALTQVPKLKEAYDDDPRVRNLLETALRLEGLSRHASTHAAGVVITPRPVVEFAPLFRSNKDEITTQWAMTDVEAVGLLKMDFLGLKTLTLITDALAAIRSTGQEPPDLAAIPLDDPATYELFSRGETSGVFQFESSGMREILRRLKPEKFEDLIALNALYRPGPLGSGMIDDFIQRRHGKVAVTYLHPVLEPVLHETYGVIVYQEQVMQIASRMAGYSLGQADLLRRAMGKKKKEVMDAEAARFVEGAKNNGIPEKEAAHIFELMAHFAGYGFNKSHSAAYALVAYQTAYIKAHWPVCFMAALLTSEKDVTDKLVEYLNECRAMGIPILAPDLHRSGALFQVEGNGIRFGLEAVKGLGEGAVESILNARAEVGRFAGLHDICRRVDRRGLNRRVLEALIKSGALDELGDRARLAGAIEQALEAGARAADERNSGQGSLFGGGGESGPPPEPILPPAPAWSDRERLAGEKESLGFYLSGHPLEAHRDRIADVTTHAVADLRGVTGEVVVAGLIGVLKRKRSKAGDWMAIFNLEDTTGTAEVVVFPKAFKEVGDLLEDDKAVVVKGRAESSEGGSPRLLAETVSTLEAAATRPVDGMTIRLEEDLPQDAFERLQEVLALHPGKTPVFFEVVRKGEFCVLLQAGAGKNVQAGRALVQEITGLLEPFGGRARIGRP